jgi:hypothetical protein
MSECGLELSGLPAGSVLDVETQNNVYTIVKDADEDFYIGGTFDTAPRPLPHASEVAGAARGW